MVTLTSSQLLAIPDSEPERLFPNDPVEAKALYRQLSKDWHPDRSSGNNDVAAKVNVLYAEAEKRFKAGTWREKNLWRFKAVNGQAYELRFLTQRPFELGTMYIGSKTVAYHVLPGAADLFERAETRLRNLPFPNDRVKAEMGRFLPNLKTTVKLADDQGYVMVLEKDPSLLCLRDVIDHFNGVVPVKHAASMISSMYNVAAYLHVTKQCHSDISPDTMFISEKHEGALLGGWWYASNYGEKLKALTERSFELLPSKLVNKKEGAPGIDASLVRATGRELFSDRAGTKLITMKDVPDALRNWLKGPGDAHALKEYQAWQKTVLPAAFGPRKYHELKLTEQDLYH